MAWSQIIDQKRVINLLRNSVAGGRVAHAYLFYGPDGVGKRAVALEFAKTLLCEQGGDEPCERCLACTKAGRMLHPDIHLLFPYPTDADESEVAERLQRLGRNPYAALDFVRRPSLDDPSKTSNKQAFYPVSRINEEVRRSVSFKPVEGRYKINIITDAELLRTQASNAFLKLLEEPTPRTVFILTTSRPERLLPTILSRCQHVRFEPLPAEAIEAALVEHEAVAPEAAATLARMADGSYAHALDLVANEDLMAMRGRVLEFYRLSWMKDIAKLADCVEDISKQGRERVKMMLRLMMRWTRDLVLYSHAGEQAVLVNVDQAEAIERFCSNLPSADLEAMAKLVEEAVDLVERNVHTALVLTVLANALGEAMRAPHSGRLYVPLAASDPVIEAA